eukprot:768330-Hanusia_phi.AAC.5
MPVASRSDCHAKDQSVQRALAAQLIANGKASRALSTILSLFGLDQDSPFASPEPSQSPSSLFNIQLAQREHRSRSEMEVATLNTLLLAYREQEDLSQSLGLLEYAQRQNLVVDDVTFNTLVDTCGLAGRADLVRKVITAYLGKTEEAEAVEEDDGRQQPGGNILVSFARQLASVSAKFPQLYKSNVCKMYTSLIRGLGRTTISGPRDRLVDVLREYKEESKTDPDVTMLTAMMDAMVNRGDAEEAKHFLEEILPDLRVRLSLSLWIDSGEALTPLQKKDISLFNAYMKGLSQVEDFSRVKETFSLIETSGVEADVVTFNTALHIACEMNNTLGTAEVLDMMEKKRVKRGAQYPC